MEASSSSGKKGDEEVLPEKVEGESAQVDGKKEGSDDEAGDALHERCLNFLKNLGLESGTGATANVLEDTSWHVELMWNGDSVRRKFKNTDTVLSAKKIAASFWGLKLSRFALAVVTSEDGSVLLHPSSLLFEQSRQLLRSVEHERAMGRETSREDGSAADADIVKVHVVILEKKSIDLTPRDSKQHYAAPITKGSKDFTQTTTQTSTSAGPKTLKRRQKNLFNIFFRFAFYVVLFVFQAGTIFVRDNRKDLYSLTRLVNQVLLSGTVGEPPMQTYFSGIRETDHIWHFLEGPVRRLFFEKIIKAEDGDNVNAPVSNNGTRRTKGWRGIASSAGSLRLRQLRVNVNASCAVSAPLRPYFASCITEFSKPSESTSTYGPGGEGFTWKSHVQLHDAEGGTGAVTGKYGWYDGSGFVYDMSLRDTNASAYDAGLRRLKSGTWIDDQSSAVFISFNVYTPASDAVVSARLLFEIDRAGVVNTASEVKALTSRDGRLTTEVVFYILLTITVSYLFIQKGMFLRKVTLRGFAEGDGIRLGEDVADYIILFFYISALVLRIIIRSARNVAHDLENNDDFISLVPQYNRERMLLFFEIILSFVAFLRMMAVLNLTSMGYLMNHTLSRCAFSLLYYGLLNAIVYFTYVVIATTIWGGVVFDFTSLFTTAQRLLHMAHGKFQMELISDTNYPVLGIMFFVAFALHFHVFFVCICIVTIVNTFIDVKKERGHLRIFSKEEGEKGASKSQRDAVERGKRNKTLRAMEAFWAQLKPKNR